MPSKIKFSLTEAEKAVISKHEKEALHLEELKRAKLLSLMAAQPPPVRNVLLNTLANETSTLEDGPTLVYAGHPRDSAELEIMGCVQHDGTPREAELDVVVEGLTRPRDRRMENAAKLLHEKGATTPEIVSGLVKMVKNKKMGKQDK